MKTKELDTIFISWNFLFALFSTFIIVQSITIGDFNKLKPLGQSMNYRQLYGHRKTQNRARIEKKEKLKMNFFR